MLLHLDYSNGILAGCFDNTFEILQRVQNIAAKMVLGRDKYLSVRQALVDLHWLPIRARINCFVLYLTAKTTRG